ncbi:hypothetical protein GCM10011365_22450 [Marinicella pacifica]|jgi:hypothetical protein|uniref:DUF3185 family protein n=1 Tax=Marinicella pacifica TaxID=1171543 RepID=A0A917FTM7_9GAMM|nr:DUF3185 family protein [Marinicella pacifica]GGG00712.1 hypothetical protein GCM10011365_22450 [Marinicella pacifica]
MSTNKIIGLVLLVLGAVLVFFGLNAADAPLEEASEALTGRYSDETMYYLIGGAVAAVVGIVLLLKK